MLADLIIAPEAHDDIAEAYDWYETQRQGLGDEFLNCVEACIDQIRRMPRLYAVVFKDYRRVLVRRFPYAVFYETDNGSVSVYCVFHCSQDPDKWKQRLS